jgi:aminoglycoside 6-adenylyltransferase
MLDNVLRYSYLQQIIEWYIGLQHDWAVNTRQRGSWFKHYLDVESWTELKSTYTGSDIDDNWVAFFCLVNLFRKMARDVGVQLGFEYPIDLELSMTEYYSSIRVLNKNGDVANGM